MGFNAQTLVEPLEYDFRPYVDAHGVIPEPNANQTDEFRRQYTGLQTRLLDYARKYYEKVQSEAQAEAKRKIDEGAEGKIPDLPPLAEEIDKFLREFDEENATGNAQAVNEAVIQMIANVCSHQPSEDELRALPARIRAGFAAWLIEELTAPKFSVDGRQLSAAPGLEAIG